MRTIKFLSVFVIVVVSVACTLAPGNDPAAGDLEIAVGDFDSSGTAPVTITLTTPSAGEGQLFLSIVPAIDVALPQRQWDLNFEAGVPQTITTSMQINTTNLTGTFKLAGNFMDAKSFVHEDTVNVYIWSEGARALQPGENIPTPATIPSEIREVTPVPSPF